MAKCRYPNEVCANMTILNGSAYCDSTPCSFKNELPKQTNAERIRSMSDEELYNFIEKIKMCGGLIRTEETSSECRGCSDGFCCNVLQWLKSEVKGSE